MPFNDLNPMYFPSQRGDCPTPKPPVILLMGVSAGGKTTVGIALAAHLGARFLDADDFHAPEARAAMLAGHPLTDNDRYPWLDRICEAIRIHRASSTAAIVLACSALRRPYRDRLRFGADPLRVVHLAIPIDLAEARMRDRFHHLPPGQAIPHTLAASQFAVLEPPSPDEQALTLDATRPVPELVRDISDWFRGSPLDTA